MSVLRTVISAFRSSQISTLTSEQCAVFIQYALAEMEHDKDGIISLLMKFLEEAAKTRCWVFSFLIFDHAFTSSDFMRLE